MDDNIQPFIEYDNYPSRAQKRILELQNGCHHEKWMVKCSFCGFPLGTEANSSLKTESTTKLTPSEHEHILNEVADRLKKRLRQDDKGRTLTNPDKNDGAFNDGLSVALSILNEVLIEDMV